MRFRLKLYIYALNGTSPTISGYVDYDPKQITMRVVNDNGHPKREINGTLEITGSDYDDIISYINDSPTIYSGQFGKLEVYTNNTLIGTSTNITIIDNDKYNKVAKIQISSYIEDEYAEILRYWDKLYNIYPTSTNTYRHYDFRQYESTSAVYYIPSTLTQSQYEQYIINLCNNYVGYMPSSITFSGTTIVTATLSLRRLYAYGYYPNPSSPPVSSDLKYPPPGKDWAFDSYILYSGTYFPKYVKKPPSFSISTWQTYTGGTTPQQDINVEGFRNFLGYLDYSNVGRLLEVVIEYVIGQIDATIAFDSSSFSDLNSTPYEYMMLLGISDFIPSDGDIQKSDPQTVLNISISRILGWLEKRGFFWYLEEITGTYYFRLKLKYNQTLGTPATDLSDYYNRNWIRQIAKYEKQDVEFWSIKNESLCKDPSFIWDYYYIIGGADKEPFKTLGDEYIFTDINNVFDAKTNDYDDSVENFVLVSCDSVSTWYQSRSDTSLYHNRTVINFALSIPYIAHNILSNLPTKYGALATYADDRLAKSNKTSLRIPLNNIYTDLDIFEYIENSQGDEMEIDEISQNLADQIATIIFKL